MEVVVSYHLLVSSSILLRYQNTSTRKNTDSQAGRAVHSGKCWIEMWGGGWGHHPPLTASTRCRLFHVEHVDSRVQKGLSSSPFCFSALQDFWTEQEVPGSEMTSKFSVRSSKLQHICVFSHQCDIVQYDGRLMLKQDWYNLYIIGRDFFFY